MKKLLSDNAKKFLAQNPTKLATILGFTFYEHPVYGDEHHIMAITPLGKLKITDSYETEDLLDWISDYIG